ncbi:hypothetical protein ACQ858_18705 [Variovorax ureilyticus]|uniref:hypothetical protein n=1 Tax=Variovorax ureilyticus TaxID=1836198 RepID=UPI003D675903
MNIAKRQIFIFAATGVAFALLFAQLYSNFLHVSPAIFFPFDRLSESEVIGGVIRYLNEPGLKYRFYLGLVDKWDSPELYNLSLELLKKGQLNTEFGPYRSSLGVQGLIYGVAYAHGVSLESLKIACAFLTALCVMLVSAGLWKGVAPGLGLSFYISILLSPWMAIFASHLYWSPFLWFLPAVFALGAYFAKEPGARVVMLSLVFASFFLKCLAGYEYISSIAVLTGAIFFIDIFLPSPRYSIKKNVGFLILIFVLCVSAFLLAFFIHAGLRGDSLVAGIKDIIEADVKRRTYSDNPNEYPEVFRESLRAGPFGVLGTYILTWDRPVIYGVNGGLFVIGLLGAVAAIVFKALRKDPTAKRDAAILAVFFAAPVSWFVLAKGHSFIHTHLNYVLWYLGCVAAVIFVNFSGWIPPWRAGNRKKSGRGEAIAPDRALTSAGGRVE